MEMQLLDALNVSLSCAAFAQRNRSFNEKITEGAKISEQINSNPYDSSADFSEDEDALNFGQDHVGDDIVSIDTIINEIKQVSTDCGNKQWTCIKRNSLK